MKWIIRWLYRKFVIKYKPVDEYQLCKIQDMNSRRLLIVYSKYITGDVQIRNDYDYFSIYHELLSRLDNTQKR